MRLLAYCSKKRDADATAIDHQKLRQACRLAEAESLLQRREGLTLMCKYLICNTSDLGRYLSKNIKEEAEGGRREAGQE